MKNRPIFKPGPVVLLLLVLLSASCRHRTFTEQRDVEFWKRSFTDPAFSLLYQDRDTTRALRFFDAEGKKAGASAVYLSATRFAIKADYHYFFSGSNDATARMLDSALAFYHTPELQNRYPRTCVHLLLFGGEIAYRLMLYNKANDYFFRAKKLADAYLTPCEQKAYNYSIAMVLYKQQNYPASLSFFRQAFARQQTCTPQNFAVVLQQQEILSNIGLCFVEQHKYDSATIYFEKAQAFARRYRDTLGPVFMQKIEGVLYGNRAKVLLAQNRLPEAELLCQKAIALNDREGYEQENAQEVKLQLAEAYRRRQNYTAMFAVLDGMRQRVKSSGDKNRLEWRRLMALYYEQTAQYAQALRCAKNYFSLRDSLSTHQRKLAAADVARRLREKEQQLQIAMLKKDNEQARLSLWIMVLFSGMSLVILSLIYQNYRRSKQNVVVLQALNKEIQAQKSAREKEIALRHQLITEAVIQAQEAERSLIGLELHDNINQVLTTVKLHNEMVLDGLGDAKKLLPRTLEYLQNCINEIRSLSKRLSAPTLGKLSLEESIKDLIDSINATSKVKITHHIEGLENQLLRQELHLGVYRILQEQLNNVLKHAEASEVFIHLECEEEQLHLLVTDNGKGFALQQRRTGIGLVNMQTRAESLNGTLQVDSQPGRGCTLKVVLPCMQQV